MGWFFGFKLHLVFNNCHEIVALKLTPGNVHDTTPVPVLTRELTGKLFGDKGYIGQKLAQDLLRRGLTLFTRVRRNMKSLPPIAAGQSPAQCPEHGRHRPHQGVLVPQSVQASIRNQRFRSHHRGHYRLVRWFCRPEHHIRSVAGERAACASSWHRSLEERLRPRSPYSADQTGRYLGADRT
jgi:hypothetical protein